MKKGWYPSAQLGDHYVFLNTLSDDNPFLHSAAKKMVSLNVNLEKDSQLVFKEGISFLRKAAESERKKENSFLESRGFTPPADGDYGTLIENINEANIGLEEFKRRVREEKNRRNVKGTGGWSYTQSLSSYISSAKNQMSGAKGGRSMKTIAGVVRSSLIKQFNSLSGSMSLDQIASAIGVSQTFLMDEIGRQVKNEDTGDILPQYLNKDGRTINQQKIESLIKNSSVYKMYIEDPKKNIEVLTEYANNILSKYGNALSKEAKDALKKAVGVDKNGRVNLERKIGKNGKDVGIDWQKVAENIQSNSKYAEILDNISPEKRYALNIVGNSGMGGEARIYNDIIKRSIIAGRWVGKAGGKIDLFTVEVGSNETVANDLSNLISKETQSQFLEVGKAFSDYYAELDKTLAGKDNSKNIFITHYNVKDYVTTNSSKFSGFEGGEYKGFQFIEAIAALQSAGFASADIDFLKTCFVNTAEEAVGASNKEGLEKYFSLFATMMLFDDGRVIAEQAANNLAFDSLKVLHIFPLNGVYVPSSVIMSLVADELEKEATIEAAKVSINTGKVNFAGELQNLTENGVFNHRRWESIRETQIAAMSARIRFLANFSAIIDCLPFS